MRRIHLTIGLALLCSPALASELQPFSARYELWLDGKQVGESRIVLRREADGRWLHRIVGTGTAGLARLARADSEQRAWFEWIDRQPRLLSASMRTDTLFSHREASVQFDWSAGLLHWQGDLAKDQPAQRAIDGQPSTGSLLNLQLALAAGRLPEGETLSYVLHDRGRASTVVYQRLPAQSLSVPAGRYLSTPLRYFQAEKQRSTTVWIASELPATPLRVLQTQDGEVRYELRLAAPPQFD